MKTGFNWEAAGKLDYMRWCKGRTWKYHLLPLSFWSPPPVQLGQAVGTAPVHVQGAFPQAKQQQSTEAFRVFAVYNDWVSPNYTSKPEQNGPFCLHFLTKLFSQFLS